MIVRFEFDRTTVFRGEADCIPTAGSEVMFRMTASAGGAEKGKLVEAIVSKDHAIRYDYDTLTPRVIVSIVVHRIEEAFE